jgi:hypothetical protein
MPAQLHRPRSQLVATTVLEVSNAVCWGKLGDDPRGPRALECGIAGNDCE